MKFNNNWKNFPLNNNYMVSKDGKIYSLIKNKLMKQIETKNGYLVVYLKPKNKRRVFKIHRIVAITFLRNENNYPHINHKDGNKKNNKLNNLEWCSPKQNMEHSLRLGLHKNLNTKNAVEKLKIKIIDTNTNKIYNSLTEAAKENNISIAAISRFINGKTKRKLPFKKL